MFIISSKYNVGSKDKRTYNGITFDSILEMRYYKDVLLPKVKSGEVISYELQKPYELQPKFQYRDKSVLPIKYIADFFIVYADGREELIDTKGKADSVALLKRKLFWYHYPTVDYKWICYSAVDGGWCDYEYVKQQQLKRRKKSVK